MIRLPACEAQLPLRNAENRILKAPIAGAPAALDAERASLGEIGHRLGRKTLGDVVTPCSARCCLKLRNGALKNPLKPAFSGISKSFGRPGKAAHR
jgi:hypothetical protein